VEKIFKEEKKSEKGKKVSKRIQNVVEGKEEKTLIKEMNA
jgi:hypothetical protein